MCHVVLGTEYVTVEYSLSKKPVTRENWDFSVLFCTVELGDKELFGHPKIVP